MIQVVPLRWAGIFVLEINYILPSLQGQTSKFFLVTDSPVNKLSSEQIQRPQQPIFPKTNEYNLILVKNKVSRHEIAIHSWFFDTFFSWQDISKLYTIYDIFGSLQLITAVHTFPRPLTAEEHWALVASELKTSSRDKFPNIRELIFLNLLGGRGWNLTD